MNKPKVTIAILTYNRAHFLKEAIEAVLNQTYSGFILMILDNASNDNTQQVVESFKDNRIVYMRHKENIGSAKSSNYAIESVETKYLIITHDDDIMKPTLLEREIKVLEDNQEVAMVSANMSTIDVNANIIKKELFPIGQDIVYGKYQFIADYCANKNYIACPTVLLRTEFIKKNNLRIKEEVGPSSDTYLWFEINTFDVFIYIIKDPLYCYRLHGNQDSAINYVDMHIVFYKYASELLAKNNLAYLAKGLKKVVVKNVVNRLFFDYVEGMGGKRIYKGQVDKLGCSGLLTGDISVIIKMKLFGLKYPSIIFLFAYKILFYLKQLFNKNNIIL